MCIPRCCRHVWPVILPSSGGRYQTAPDQVVGRSPGSRRHPPMVSAQDSVGSQARSPPHPSALFRPCLQPSERVPASSFLSKSPPAALEAILTGRKGLGRAGTAANSAETALTGAVRTGCQASVGDKGGFLISDRLSRTLPNLHTAADARQLCKTLQIQLSILPAWINIR